MSLLAVNSGWTVTTCPRALSTGLSRIFRRATTVANCVLLTADLPPESTAIAVNFRQPVCR